MSDEKWVSLCVLVGILGTCYALTKCIPAMNDHTQTKMRICLAANGSYVNGDCVGTGQK